MEIVIWVDAKAAKAVVSRIGLGKVRHMEVKYLWAQQAHRKNRFQVKKVAGVKNPADILTKPLSYNEIREKLEIVGGRLERRRKVEKIEAKVQRKRWVDMSDETEDDEVLWRSAEVEEDEDDY